MITVLVLMTFYDENGLHKAGSITKVKESDFNPDYMKKLNPPSPGGSTELSELDDVDISGVTDGEVLTYDAATEKWVNSVGGGSGSVINNIFDDGEGHVESMDIDGTTYEFGTGETTIDLSSIQTDSNGKVSEMSIDGTNCEFTTVGSVTTEPYGKVESMEINGTSYDFATGNGNMLIEQVSPSMKNKVKSIDATIGVIQSTLEFPALLEDLEDVDITGITDGEVLTYQNGGWTYSAPTKIENISETGGVVDSMEIDGATYNFATGGGGGGSSKVTSTMTYLNQNSSLFAINLYQYVEVTLDVPLSTVMSADVAEFHVAAKNTDPEAYGQVIGRTIGLNDTFATFIMSPSAGSAPMTFTIAQSYPGSTTYRVNRIV